MMKHKIIPCVLVFETFEHKLNKPTNKNSIKVPKVVMATNYKTL